MDVYLLGEGCGSHDLRKICLDRDIHILGYVDPDCPTALRSRQPNLGLAEVAGRPFDLVIVANPQYGACVQVLLDLGVAPTRILPFYIDIPLALERLGPVTAFAMRRRGTTDEYLVLPMEGKFTQDTRTHAYGPADAELAGRLCRMFTACDRALADQDPLYRVGENWGNFLKATRGPLYAALDRGDHRSVFELLENFWRNGLGEGIIAGEAAFHAFSAVPDASLNQSLHPYLRALGQSLGTDFDASDVALPLAGNPFGVVVDGHLIQENSVMNLHRGVYLSGLLEDLERPVVAEIGGGVGFFARALLNQDARITYIDFDLPETLLVEGYFLARSFPGRRVYMYDGTTPELTPALLAAYDIFLLPTFMLPRLPAASVDLFVNTISFGEMSLPIVDNFLTQIDRVTRKFFYHENLCDLNFDYENYSADFFHIPESFKEVFTAPSRWPVFGPGSNHHSFTEHLYIKRGRVF